MTFQDLYLGQHVRILSWDELNSIGHYDSIGGIHLPDDTFFSDKMSWIYVLDGSWFPFPFTEDMFVLAPPVPASTISFDDLLKGAA